MEISNICQKLRYFSNPNFLFSLLYPSQTHHFFSSPKTLISITNPSSSASDKLNASNRGDCVSYFLFSKNPSLNRPQSLLPSFRSNSISSVTVKSLLSPSPETVEINRCTNYRITLSLGPVHSVSRSFSISSLDVSPSRVPPGTPDSSEKSNFEEFGRGVLDESQGSRTNLKRQSQASRGSVKHKTDSHKPNVSLREVTEIVELLKGGEDDLESKLSRMNVKISCGLIIEVLHVLNCDGVAALRFFDWVREAQPDVNINSEIWSLVFYNLGRLGNYESMLLLLMDLSKKGICLTEKAFGFLPVSSSAEASIRDSVKIVTEILNKAGGSCRSSGIYALIKMLCILNLFDLAIFVMEETARKTSYYNVLIWAKCRSSNFQEARDLLDEMRKFGCDPNANSYNYLLSSLCKNGRTAEACNVLEAMKEWGCLPNAVTFEVIMHHACRLRRLDFATEFLNQMRSSGIEPRLTTHATFIKGCFYDGRFQEAYKYVVDMDNMYKCSSNNNYSLLASLHQKKGWVVEAREILVEMIEKGLKPNFSVYMRVMKDLHKLRKGDLVADLKHRFAKFSSNTEVG